MCVCSGVWPVCALWSVSAVGSVLPSIPSNISGLALRRVGQPRSNVSVYFLFEVRAKQGKENQQGEQKEKGEAKEVRVTKTGVDFKKLNSAQ